MLTVGRTSSKVYNQESHECEHHSRYDELQKGCEFRVSARVERISRLASRVTRTAILAHAHPYEGCLRFTSILPPSYPACNVTLSSRTKYLLSMN
jgi:hypothetical protein